MKALSVILLIGAWACAPSLVKAQGCSDAGFCTIGNLKQSTASPDSSRHTLGLMVAAGLGDERVLVFTPALQHEYRIDRHWSTQAKLTANHASGNLGTASGLGDLYLSGTYLFNPARQWKWSATVGVKLPLSRSDRKEDGRPLPMQYQSSLGTTDAIAGIGISNRQWQFAAGYQQPLSGSNHNAFLPAYWPGDSDAAKYPSTRDLKRKADLLLRASYQLVARKRFQLSAGLLGIYHVGRDAYSEAGVNSRHSAINGSEGLTLNLTASAKWTLNEKIHVGFQAGTPLVARDIRPDGLTRSIVVSPEISWNF